MANYYVDSANGNDDNNGSLNSPFKTLKKAGQTAVNSDTVYVRRGLEYQGQSTFTNYINIKSYGVGKNPLVCCYYKNAPSATFMQVQKNIWRTYLLESTQWVGYSADESSVNQGNVGFIYDVLNDMIYGNKKTAFTELTENFDFISGEQDPESIGYGYLYIYCDKNPLEYIKQMILSVLPKNGAIMTLTNVNIQDIDFAYIGGNAMAANENFNIYNCNFYKIGGSFLSGKTRIGNGIQMGNVNNSTIKKCKFEDIYDTATTIQGNNYNANGLDLSYCESNRCNQFVEIWSGDNPCSINNVMIHHNKIIKCGYGFGGINYPNNFLAPFIFYKCPNLTGNNNSYFKNVIINPKELIWGMLSEYNVYPLFINGFINANYNTYFLNKDKMFSSEYKTIEEFRKNLLQEKNSKIYLIDFGNSYNAYFNLMKYFGVASYSLLDEISI